MQIENRDTAFVYIIHCGVTRKGQPFVESNLVENVLGDIAHKHCMGFVMNAVQGFIKDFLDHHFGSEVPIEDVAEHVTGDDVMDFFDRHRDILDE